MRFIPRISVYSFFSSSSPLPKRIFVREGKNMQCLKKSEILRYIFFKKIYTHTQKQVPSSYILQQKMAKDDGEEMSSAVAIVQRADADSGALQPHNVIPQQQLRGYIMESLPPSRKACYDDRMSDLLHKNLTAIQSATGAVVESVVKLESIAKRFDAMVNEFRDAIDKKELGNIRRSRFAGVGCCGCLYGITFSAMVIGALLLVFVLIFAAFAPSAQTAPKI